MHDFLNLLTLEAGALLFSEGDAGDCAYIIKSGCIEIFVGSGEGRIVLARRGPGDIIGEMGLIDQGSRSASAVAVDDCELLVVTGRQIEHRIANTDPILRMCLGVVIQRYRETLALAARGDTQRRTRSEAPAAELNGVVEALTLEQEMQRALRRGEFELYLQPIVQLDTRTLAGFEGLIRWNHPRRGLLLPAHFIPAAETSGLIVDITKWCLNELTHIFPALAGAMLRRAVAGGETAADGCSLFMSINVSGHDLVQPAFAETVQRILRDSGIAPRNLKLEITESMLMKDPAGAALILDACRLNGVGVAVDDFGTGYSNLSYLSTLPITTLKIDRGFVRAMADDPKSLKIVSTIRYLARELDIAVVAEGIEEEAQAATLAAMQCEFGQGYLFGRPAPLSETLDRIRDWPVPRLPTPVAAPSARPIRAA